jgi:hypothetical protein
MRHCGECFDFSDHLVLFSTHFFMLSSFECHVLLSAPSCLGRWKAILMCFHACLNSVILFEACQTAMYFHTDTEMAAGAVVAAFVLVPYSFVVGAPHSHPALQKQTNMTLVAKECSATELLPR